MFITADDVDGDGRNDIVVGAWWSRNPGTVGGTWKRHAVGAPLNNMAVVHDFDEDGDPDVLGTNGIGSKANAEFVWAPNDGEGRFTIHETSPAAMEIFCRARP